MQSPVQTLPLRCLPRLLSLALATLAAPLAQAALSDTFQPFVAATYVHDDNVLRLDDDTPGFSGPRSDNIRQLQAGVEFKRPIGRQVLTGHANVTQVDYDHYSQLNYTGRDALVDLEWHLGNHLSGHVGAAYVQSQTPFNGNVTQDSNLRVQHNGNASIGWLLHPSWRLHAGVVQDKFRYDSPFQRFNNRRETTTDAGVDYLASSSSKVGLLVRHTKGEYDYPRIFNGQLADTSYQQDEINADIFWVFSEATQFQFLGGYAKRSYDQATTRDAKGPNGRASFFWSPASRVHLVFAGWRVFEAVEGTLVNSSRNTGASANATWDLTSKLRATGRVQRERRNFNAANGLVLPAGSSDSSNTVSAGLIYAPTQSSQISLNASHLIRHGSPVVGSYSYSSNTISLSGSIQF